jgi:hypothetical protein
MTLSSNEPSRSAQADREADVRRAIDNLNIALEATKLALDMAKDAPERVGLAQQTAPQLIESWRASTLLLHEVVDNLYYEGRHTISSVRQVLALD